MDVAFNLSLDAPSTYLLEKANFNPAVKSFLNEAALPLGFKNPNVPNKAPVPKPQRGAVKSKSPSSIIDTPSNTVSIVPNITTSFIICPIAVASLGFVLYNPLACIRPKKSCIGLLKILSPTNLVIDRA